MKVVWQAAVGILVTTDARQEKAGYGNVRFVLNHPVKNIFWVILKWEESHAVVETFFGNKTLFEQFFQDSQFEEF